MKNSHIILAVIAILLVGVFAFAWSRNSTPIINPPVDQQASIIGCYVAGTEKDVYTMHLESEQEGNVSGTLNFKNFEKDSSSGTFAGIYQNGILLGDYTFNSEGSVSVMQVVFQKSGDDFVRGYGPVDAEGTRFTDLNAITYDSSSTLSVFKKEACTS